MKLLNPRKPLFRSSRDIAVAGLRKLSTPLAALGGFPERQALVRVAGKSERPHAGMDPRLLAAMACVALALLTLTACDDSGASNEGGPVAPVPVSQYSVGGSVSGLAGSGLLLQNNGGGNLNVVANGSFAFGTPLSAGVAYAVTVATQPSHPAQTCVVTNGSGTANANVTSVSIVCTTTSTPPPPPPPPPTKVTIGGMVSGLSGTGLVLQDNGGDNLAVAANGAFTFATSIVVGGAYAVTVATQPVGPNQSCSVSAGSGTAPSTNVTNVAIVCRIIGKFAYTANNQSDNVSGYAINPTSGALTPVPGSPVTTGTGPAQVALAPNGKFTYIPDALGRQIDAYSIDPVSGSLTPVPGSPFPTPFVNPYQFATIAVDSQSKYLYLSSQADNAIAGFAIDAVTGALTAIPGSPFLTFAGAGTTAIPAFSPDGKFLYVMNETAGSVSGFSISATTGALTPIPGGPFATGATPTWISFVPGGNFAYVSNSGANSLSAYSVDATTGALTPLAGSPFATGTKPQDLTIDAAGTHLYVPNNTSNSVSAFSIDAVSGALSAVTGSPFTAGVGPTFFDIEATGRFAYVSSGGGNDVYGYAIDPTTGALTSLPGSPFAAGMNPLFIISDPSGKFAYAANHLSNDISAYAIDSTSGVLTPVAGGPVATGSAPIIVSISPEAPGLRD